MPSALFGAPSLAEPTPAPAQPSPRATKRRARTTVPAGGSRGGPVWGVFCALIAALSLVAWGLEHFGGGLGTPGLASLRWSDRLDWQPHLAWDEPWRLWSAAFVHWSGQHLLVNLAGVTLIGALGLTLRVSLRTTWAWVLAWPLTHLALLLQTDLEHYGGLSGVLHAAVAAVAVRQCFAPGGRARALGIALVTALALKIALERPWELALTRPPGWDIAVAPLAHAAGGVFGTLAGLVCEVCAMLALWWRAR